MFLLAAWGRGTFTKDRAVLLIGVYEIYRREVGNSIVHFSYVYAVTITHIILISNTRTALCKRISMHHKSISS